MDQQETVMQTYPVRLRERGQITLPQPVRDRLDVADGGFLTLVEIGDLLFLSPRPLQVPRLADKLADLLEESELTLADLLQGLQQERIAITQERNR